MLIVDKERNGENSTLSVHLFRYILFSTAFDSLKNKTSNLTFFLETLQPKLLNKQQEHSHSPMKFEYPYCGSQYYPQFLSGLGGVTVSKKNKAAR